MSKEYYKTPWGGQGGNWGSKTFGADAPAGGVPAVVPPLASHEPSKGVKMAKLGGYSAILIAIGFGAGTYFAKRKKR